MKYLRLEKEGNVNVVSRVGKKPIDPMASKRACIEALEKTDEWSAYEAAAHLVGNVRPAHKKDKVDMERWRGEMRKAHEKAISARKKLNIVHAQLAKDNLVRFPLLENEKEITDEEFENTQKIFNERANDEFMLESGELVKDRRGEILFTVDDEEIKIKALNQKIPDGAKKYSELTDEDKVRIQRKKRAKAILKLSKLEKEAAKEKELKSLATRLSYSVMAAEVAGASREDALLESQAQYKKKAEEIESDYK